MVRDTMDDVKGEFERYLARTNTMLHRKEAIKLLRNHILQDYTALDTLLSTLLTLAFIHTC